MPTTVITGGAGFLGSHLCDRFLAEGHRVIAVDNLHTGNLRNLEHIVNNPQLEFIEHDISKPLTISGEIDNVLHFASPASPPIYLKFPMETMKVGAHGTFNSCDLALEKKARFLMASTSEIYGDPEVHPQPESYWGNVNSVGPRGVYDEAKRFAEAVTMAYHTHFGLETRIVRIFNTYGPRMSLKDGRVVPSFIDSVLHHKPITVYGDGSQTRSFCYVTDLVDGIYRLLMSDEVLPVNIGTTFEHSMLEFADIIKRLAGSNVPVIHLDLPKDDPKQRKPLLDKARSILGWEAKVPLEEGLLRTIEFFRQQLQSAKA